MKRAVFLIIACLTVVNLYSQTETVKKNTIGAHLGLGIGGVKAQPAHAIVGIDYSRRLGDYWSLCTGIEYLEPYITSIPVQLKGNFKNNKNHGYIKFGTDLNVIEANVGLGLNFSIGFEWEVNNITYSLNPYVGGSLFNLNDPHKDSNYFKLGISFGIGYKL